MACGVFLFYTSDGGSSWQALSPHGCYRSFQDDPLQACMANMRIGAASPALMGGRVVVTYESNNYPPTPQNAFSAVRAGPCVCDLLLLLLPAVRLRPQPCPLRSAVLPPNLPMFASRAMQCHIASCNTTEDGSCLCQKCADGFSLSSDKMACVSGAWAMQRGGMEGSTSMPTRAGTHVRAAAGRSARRNPDNLPYASLLASAVQCHLWLQRLRLRLSLHGMHGRPVERTGHTLRESPGALLSL